MDGTSGTVLEVPAEGTGTGSDHALGDNLGLWRTHHHRLDADDRWIPRWTGPTDEGSR